jgi:seryl-tRNA synthetase
MKKAEVGKIQKEITQRAKEKKPFDDLKQRKTEIEEEVKAAEPELEKLEHAVHQKVNRLGNIVHASVKGISLFLHCQEILFFCCSLFNLHAPLFLPLR